MDTEKVDSEVMSEFHQMMTEIVVTVLWNRVEDLQNEIIALRDEMSTLKRKIALTQTHVSWLGV